MLKQEYKDGVTLQEAKALSIKILAKTLDTTKLSPEKCKKLWRIIFLNLKLHKLFILF